ncbi:phosphoserine phosphatase 1 [Ruminiclostridium hungatei]|uniref:Phosphoserine phosphatase 1 n=1 Tax=Ruminiclostridium hungatei TaxID=48256 RepID=A0A1V4SED4_RUMHU|nr:histidine phosphatase family protein [Ruminiclostridium hungatei]OPX42228.1 phosphoserine phosphatase 1 [Ruminiclostridium hungatei]
MLKLYITRHGETEWNVQGRMQGWKNSNLTPKGIKNAEALGKRLESVAFKVIYSSSSQRAIHTSELIRGDRKIEIITDENLREINLGQWEGKAKDEFSEADKDSLEAFWNRPHQYEAQSGEDFHQVRIRIEAVLKRIISENGNCNVMIVTHAVIVKTIMAIFKGIPIEKLWEQPFIHGTSLSIVEIDNLRPDGRFEARVLTEGDMSHAQG